MKPPGRFFPPGKFLDPIGVLGTLVIRIAAITLASDSAMTLARFRPAEVRCGILR